MRIQLAMDIGNAAFGHGDLVAYVDYPAFRTDRTRLVAQRFDVIHLQLQRTVTFAGRKHRLDGAADAGIK